MKFSLPPDSIFSGRALARRERVAIAILIGVAAALAAWIAFQLVPAMEARDFTYPWLGARALLSGLNPFDAVHPAGPPPRDHWFMYPLTAAMAVAPIAWLPAQVAGALFSGIGAGALAFVLSREGGMSSFWLFLSPSFGMAVVLGQWSPMLMAAAIAAPLAWLLTCKPTIGLPLYLFRPTRLSTVLCLVFVLASLVLHPTWPMDFLRNSRTVQEHHIPLFRPFGILCGLALLRWRRPEARIVVGMSAVPQNMYFYDQLPLFLVATTAARRVLLVALSWVAWFGARIGCETPQYCGREAERWVILLVYVPAAMMVLLDRTSTRWLRERLAPRGA